MGTCPDALGRAPWTHQRTALGSGDDRPIRGVDGNRRGAAHLWVGHSGRPTRVVGLQLMPHPGNVHLRRLSLLLDTRLQRQPLWHTDDTRGAEAGVVPVTDVVWASEGGQLLVRAEFSRAHWRSLPTLRPVPAGHPRGSARQYCARRGWAPTVTLYFCDE